MAEPTLTLEEKATNYETMRHIEQVRGLLAFFVVELLERGRQHDQSKLEPPEVQLCTELTPRLAKCTYGSAEYQGFLKDLKPALTHHYARNRHHPEYHKRGIRDMNLVDLVEMFCDWKAASTRHDDGNINKSIEINADRFGMGPELVNILENTAKLVG